MAEKVKVVNEQCYERENQLATIHICKARYKELHRHYSLQCGWAKEEIDKRGLKI